MQAQVFIAIGSKIFMPLCKLGSMITNDARCTREIKARIAMADAAFNKKKTLSTGKLDLELRKKSMKFYIWSGNSDSSETRSEVRGKF
jgi:hypothetical protein